MTLTTTTRHPLLAVSDLRTSFRTDEGTLTAIDGVGFDVHSGETVCIVGESGSGKTVASESITRLIQTPPGEISDGSIRFGDDEIVRRLAASYPGRTIDLDTLNADHGIEKVVDQLLEQGISPIDITDDSRYHGMEPAEISGREIVRAGVVDMRTLVEKRFTDQVGVTEEDAFVVTGADGGYIDLTRAPKKALRSVRGSGIAHIFQNPQGALNHVYTVGWQIREAIRTHQDVPKSDAREKAIELLDRVGIPEPGTRVDDYPHEFSGGQKQRIVVAMALAADPALLIADEPTTALDVTIQAQILQLIEDLQEEYGMGVLFITHDLGVVAEIADRVVVVYSGKVMERGGVFEIFENPSHPYTRALLRCLPGRGGNSESIGGQLPDPIDPPAGCRFAPRCRYAIDACHTGEQPPLYQIDSGENHTVSCVHYGPDGDPSVVRDNDPTGGEIE